MPVPVIVVVPGQEPIRESAAAFAERRRPNIDLGEARLPSRLQIDASTPAIPVGSGRLDNLGAAAFHPTQSVTYAVRATADFDRSEDVPDAIDGRRVFADPRIEPFVTCGSTPPIGSAASVATQLNLAALHARGLDGTNVAIAIVDTGINLAFLSGVLSGVKLDVDVLIGAPKATLLDFPILAASAPGGSTVGRTLSTAMLAFSQLLTGWAVAFAPGGVSMYQALVVNNSWGIYHPSWDFPPGHRGRFVDNPQHPFNLLVTTMAQSGIDIVFAAGNCGPACADLRCQSRTAGAIMGANAHADVLTLGGCDTLDQIVGYSSQGPSIANMPPQKPDLAAYTHFLGSQAFGTGTPDSGTSAACPVAAGCVAAIRAGVLPTATPPTSLFAQLRATARAVSGQTGWQVDFGHGIIDPDATARSLGV